jgi:Hemocyanin, copper containing domain
MVDLPEVQDRSQRVFEDLLRQSGRVPPAAAIREPALASAPPPGARVAPAPARFSVFDPEQAAAASEFALGLAVQAAAASDLAEGLDAVLSRASQAARTEDPEFVHFALSLFVTHSTEGRRLVKPRIAFAEPRKLAPSTLRAPGPPLAPAAAAGSTGDERRLDFWREDPLASEHHEHWHEVYPFAGLFPADFVQWAAVADRQGLLEILQGLDSAQDWQAFLASSDARAIAGAFVSRANALSQQNPPAWIVFLKSLSARAYGTLFHLNDRQGELFFYMHQQMLARYGVERLAHDLSPVVPLSDFSAPIPEGYDPGDALKRFDGFRERRPGQTLASGDGPRRPAATPAWRRRRRLLLPVRLALYPHAPAGHERRPGLPASGPPDRRSAGPGAATWRLRFHELLRRRGPLSGRAGHGISLLASLP